MSAKFPSAAATDTDLYVAVNNIATVLSGAHDNAVVTITVSSTSGFPTSGVITIELEAIAYTGKTSNTFTGCTRGFDGTTAASHADTIAVIHAVVAAHHNALKDEIEAIENALAQFPVGTIVKAPSAPTQFGGSWHACDGSVLSQSTYAALFSVIGHTYFGYNDAVTSTIPQTATRLVWAGDCWIGAQNNGVSTYSLDGTTWTSAGTIGNMAGTFTLFAGTVNGHAIAVGTSATGLYYTTDRGITWTSGTLPSSANYLVRESTSGNWIALKTGTTNILYSSNNGSTWSTATGVLPASIANIDDVYWNGSAWYIWDVSGWLNTTTDATGASGWSRTAAAPMLAAGFVRNSTTALSSGNIPTGGFIASISSPTGGYFFFDIWVALSNPFWNGKVFSYGSSGAFEMSADGLTWGTTIHSGRLTTTVSSINQQFPVDTVTGNYMSWNGSTATSFYAPKYNLSTQFCLPNRPGYVIRVS